MIDIAIGDALDVYQNAANGWSYGKNTRSGLSGWFPTNFTVVRQAPHEEEYSYYDDEYSCSEEIPTNSNAKEIAKLQEMVAKTQNNIEKLRKSIMDLKTLPIQNVNYQSPVKDEAQLLQDEYTFILTTKTELEEKLKQGQQEIAKCAIDLETVSAELAKAQTTACSAEAEKQEKAEEELSSMIIEHKEIEALEEKVFTLEEQLNAKELVSEDAVEYIELKRELFGLMRERDALKKGLVGDYGKFLQTCEKIKK